MKTSIIMVNYNGLALTKQCIESFKKYHSSVENEIIVVDNNSTDRSQIELPSLFPDIIFISLPDNKGFGSANNAGASRAAGEYLLFVNNDTLFVQECITPLISRLKNTQTIGIIAPQLLNLDRSIQLSYGDYPTILNEWKTKRTAGRLEKPGNEGIVDWVSGAALMMKRSLFFDVHGFDENYFMYFEDTDLCKRITRKDLKVYYLPEVKIIHLGGKSYNKGIDTTISVEYRRSQLRYYRTHNPLIQNVLVRLYLLVKYFPRLFYAGTKNVSRSVIAELFGARSAGGNR